MPPFVDSDFQVSSDPAPIEPVPPRIGDWLWRPWYAKLWWILIFGFWLGAFLAQWVPRLSLVFHDDHFPVIFLVLHPFAAIPVLGFGFARKWMQFYTPASDETDDMHEVHYSATGLGLRQDRSPVGDPCDHRI